VDTIDEGRGWDEAKAVSSDVSQAALMDVHFNAAYYTPHTPDSDCLSSVTCTLAPSHPVNAR
jgi:hypothetical protein